MSVADNLIIKDGLTFQFPANTQSSEYDDWSFYRNQFNSAFGGAKAVDLIHIEGNKTWLIEIKDYRAGRQRTRLVDLGKEVAHKVRDTLAGLTAAKCNANDSKEKHFANNALRTDKLRVILHLEQPTQHSRLFPRVIDPAKVQLKLKQWLKAVDAHPAVVDQNNLKADMNWTAQG